MHLAETMYIYIYTYFDTRVPEGKKHTSCMYRNINNNETTKYVHMICSTYMSLYMHFHAVAEGPLAQKLG